MSARAFPSCTTYTFFREEGFYVVELPDLPGVLEANVATNPGTIKVEKALTGEVVWQKDESK